MISIKHEFSFTSDSIKTTISFFRRSRIRFTFLASQRSRKLGQLRHIRPCNYNLEHSAALVIPNPSACHVRSQIQVVGLINFSTQSFSNLMTRPHKSPLVQNVTRDSSCGTALRPQEKSSLIKIESMVKHKPGRSSVLQ